jgi:ABC-type bacteriocin/lantibiotic exporter with double-glycine peptidase domain
VSEPAASSASDRPTRLDLWRYYAGYFRGQTGLLALIVALVVTQPATTFPVAFLLRQAFDVALPHHDSIRAAFIGGAVAMLYLANNALTLGLRMLSFRVTKRAVSVLRRDMVRHLFQLSRATLTHVQVEWLHSVLTQDTERVDVLSNAVISQILPQSIMILGLGVVVLVLSPPLFACFVVAAPIVAIATWVLRSRLGRSVRGYNRAYSAYSGGMLFVLQHADLTRAYGAERFEIERQSERIESLRGSSLAMMRVISTLGTVQTALVALMQAVMLTVGMLLIIHGDLTLGKLLAVYVVVALLSTSASTLINGLTSALQGRESLINLRRLAQLDHAQAVEGGIEVDPAGVELEDVSFGYTDQDVVRQVSLRCAPGSITGIAGANGSGKTTLLWLILGFYQPRVGRVLLSGCPTDAVDLRHARARMGVVLQEPAVFAGTVRENITYGRDDLSQDDIIAASQLAGLHDFVITLPDGYDTYVGDEGMTLSGGQRQRLALARAFVRRPSLVILDEPTNHLDSAAAERLVQTISALPGRPTVLVVSHDSRILATVDQVVRLDNGRVVEAVSAQQGA